MLNRWQVKLKKRERETEREREENERGKSGVFYAGLRASITAK
jgi:hypothetical protein